jgi:hypothetical protein
MLFQTLTLAAEEYFPKLRVKYKNQSKLMKFLGALLFFNKDFMNNYVTTVGSVIYFPNQHFIKLRPVSSVVLFLHELVFMHSSKKLAYFSSLYVIQKLSEKMNFVPHLEAQSQNFMEELNKPWVNHPSLQKEFQIAIQKIQTGERPYSHPIFNILDDLISKL